MGIFKLSEKDTALLVIDVQEKLFPVMGEKDILLKNLLKLVTGCRLLDLPIFFFEQNKKGLGETILELREFMEEDNLFHKNSFGVGQNHSFFERLNLMGIKNILICGIEAHVCVFQSAMDLKKQGFNVAYIADCVSSRREKDREVAESRLSMEGGYFYSAEMALFEIMQTCEHKKFKHILSVVK